MLQNGIMWINSCIYSRIHSHNSNKLDAVSTFKYVHFIYMYLFLFRSSINYFQVASLSLYNIISIRLIWHYSKVQTTLVISNCKGLSEILRDIRTSTYQTCRIEEKLIRLTTFNKYMCNWTLEIYWKYCEKEEKLLLRSNFSSFPQYFLHVRFSCLGREQIFHFEISSYSR